MDYLGKGCCVAEETAGGGSGGGNYLPLTGGTMSGAIQLPDAYILNDQSVINRGSTYRKDVPQDFNAQSVGLQDWEISQGLSALQFAVNRPGYVDYRLELDAFENEVNGVPARMQLDTNKEELLITKLRVGSDGGRYGFPQVEAGTADGSMLALKKDPESKGNHSLEWKVGTDQTLNTTDSVEFSRLRVVDPGGDSEIILSRDVVSNDATVRFIHNSVPQWRTGMRENNDYVIYNDILDEPVMTVDNGTGVATFYKSLYAPVVVSPSMPVTRSGNECNFSNLSGFIQNGLDTTEQRAILTYEATFTIPFWTVKVELTLATLDTANDMTGTNASATLLYANNDWLPTVLDNSAFGSVCGSIVDTSPNAGYSNRAIGSVTGHIAQNASATGLVVNMFANPPVAGSQRMLVQGFVVYKTNTPPSFL